MRQGVADERLGWKAEVKTQRFRRTIWNARVAPENRRDAGSRRSHRAWGDLTGYTRLLRVCDEFDSVIVSEQERGFVSQKRRKKLTLEEAAEKLTAIAERHLSALPEEEQDARVAAFARVKFGPSRGTRAKSSSRPRTRRSRAIARGR